MTSLRLENRKQMLFPGLTKGTVQEVERAETTYKLVMNETFGVLWHYYTSNVIKLKRKRLIYDYESHLKGL